jgi:nucleoside-diphosphate-sugar epimerase
MGFALFGIPVGQLVEASGIEATYVYFGNLVYGPGKVFADQYITGLKKGSACVVGKGTNRLPLVHMTDAARALVHLAGLPRTQLVGRTFIAKDGAGTTQRELLDDTAAFMGVKRPAVVPAWLATLVAGSIAVETITIEAHTDPSALLTTGFLFRYPSHREGVPATLAALGYTPSTGR